MTLGKPMPPFASGFSSLRWEREGVVGSKWIDTDTDEVLDDIDEEDTDAEM